jgi:N-acetyl-alpha-D-muramate 1-phosphate uridylyltransferase
MTSSTFVKPKAAFVLAAGLGTRMRPLTNDVPKPMVVLDGRPLIDHVLERLASAGIERAIVNVHYKPLPLRAHLQGKRAPIISISDETGELLDTGGGVVRAITRFPSEIGAEPFFIHNSDTVWLEPRASNLDRMIAAWKPDRMDSLLLLAAQSDSIGYDGYGDFHLALDGTLKRRTKTESTPFVFAGVSIAHPRMFEQPPDGPFSLNILWDAAIARGRVFGIVLDGLWMHVGTPQALIEAEERMAHAAGR